VRFAFDPEQLEFRDAARNLLEKECPPSAVRAAWENDTGRVPGLWDRLVEMGLFELDELDSILVLEETGRACVPEPVVEAWALGRADATLAIAGSPFAAGGVPAARPASGTPSPMRSRSESTRPAAAKSSPRRSAATRPAR